MSGFGIPNKSRRAISATEDEIVALLDRLDAQDSDDAADAASESESKRFEYRVDSCEVTLQHIGATNEVRFVVPTRNLSVDGMTFLHSGFAHTGSKCTLGLVTTNGSSANVKGVVSGCRYVGNWMHEVSVSFNAEIHAASFCPPSPEWSALIVVADDDDVRQVKHYLTVLRADVRRAGSCGDIITMVEKAEFDCVFIELQPLGVGGLDAIEAIRSSGYEGKILGILEEGDQEHADAAVSAGCTQCLYKPYAPELMKSVYEAVRGSAPAGDD